jgi:hypothetical protein
MFQEHNLKKSYNNLIMQQHILKSQQLTQNPRKIQSSLKKRKIKIIIILAKRVIRIIAWKIITCWSIPHSLASPSFFLLFLQLIYFTLHILDIHFFRAHLNPSIWIFFLVLDEIKNCAKWFNFLVWQSWSKIGNIQRETLKCLQNMTHGWLFSSQNCLILAQITLQPSNPTLQLPIFSCMLPTTWKL